ncbi:hypothetical protein [Aureispira sp. CCB-E]|uniref:hypothetical protein n=1 Tax=Aureispira sp. CCB-E TaxID=3051121 RepID=UPI0028695AF9|nr:hypothetical protein [Aureispira sp. CCB-E]WMX15294.1 hypothetical protein QP953_02775 [Aureispira sp. CCB-E]
MEKEQKKEEKTLESIKNAENTNFSVSENEQGSIAEKTAFDKHLETQGFDSSLIEQPEEDNFNLDDFDDLDFDDDLDDLDLDDLDIDEGEDPLNDFKDEEPDEPSTTTIGDIKEPITGNSPKNLENIEKLANILLNGADVLKAQLCSKISGEHIAEYLADDDIKSTLIEAIKEYLATQEIKAPTPFGTLLMALAMWTLPPLGVAVWDKYQVNKKTAVNKKTSTNLNEEQQAAGEHKTDYSHLKEYQDRRKIFSLAKTKGTYNRTPKGTFIKVEHANEEPSPIVRQWIEEGLTNKQIKERLGYE